MNTPGNNPFQIWVDADACPAPIKEILYRTARRLQVGLTLVANQPLRTPPSQYIKTLQVPPGFDAADDKIIELTQSGDLTLFAKRDNILVIREENGTREFARLDISSNKIFESPYFNLQQNDFIYVEPNKTKFIANDVITNRNIRNLGLGLTILSTVLLLVTLFK